MVSGLKSVGSTPKGGWRARKILPTLYLAKEAARAYLEAQRWPTGPYCSHCGATNVVRMQGARRRPGVFNCRECRKGVLSHGRRRIRGVKDDIWNNNVSKSF
jgi:transposase-like protein